MLLLASVMDYDDRYCRQDSCACCCLLCSELWEELESDSKREKELEKKNTAKAREHSIKLNRSRLLATPITPTGTPTFNHEHTLALLPLLRCKCEHSAWHDTALVPYRVVPCWVQCKRSIIPSPSQSLALQWIIASAHSALQGLTDYLLIYIVHVSSKPTHVVQLLLVVHHHSHPLTTREYATAETLWSMEGSCWSCDDGRQETKTGWKRKRAWIARYNKDMKAKQQKHYDAWQQECSGNVLQVASTLRAWSNLL